ncbi:hypothetical protein B0H15DRAFT_155233 [Mycena belliarum]|uniref:Uncharacterized protein n=1 Tax=Mycena belliarum TaxID=1033014 RepID=A0AAD6U9U3_9AGAR|nr:hypothetical protein B0H15DRAFT_155233 [Mycena belliae]
MGGGGSDSSGGVLTGAALMLSVYSTGVWLNQLPPRPSPRKSADRRARHARVERDSGESAVAFGGAASGTSGMAACDLRGGFSRRSALARRIARRRIAAARTWQGEWVAASATSARDDAGRTCVAFCARSAHRDGAAGRVMQTCHRDGCAAGHG